MSCTTLLVGKNASYDGSTMIARNDDSGADGFTPKKFVVISSKEQKRKYKTVESCPPEIVQRIFEEFFNRSRVFFF